MMTFLLVVLAWTAVSLVIGGVWGWARWAGRRPASVQAWPVVQLPAPRARADQPAQRV